MRRLRFRAVRTCDRPWAVEPALGAEPSDASRRGPPGQDQAPKGDLGGRSGRLVSRRHQSKKLNFGHKHAERARRQKVTLACAILHSFFAGSTR